MLSLQGKMEKKKRSSKKENLKSEPQGVEIQASEASITINPEQIKTFNSYEGLSWDPSGPLKPLHELNPVRLSFIKNHLVRLKNLDAQSQTPYAGLKMLDVGCGPGLLCEPLARLGATVTGIDASDRFLDEAKAHAVSENLSIVYEHKPIEACKDELYEVIFALEVVEHVDNVDIFLESCLDLLKPGGVIFISTLNRTPMSYLKSIILAEYILKWIPQGTHDWKRFLTPAEIATILRKKDFFFTDLKGIDYNPFKREWKLTSSLKANYIGCALKR